jgi:hypothetical protein
MPIDTDDLAQFYGTEGYLQYSPLFPRMFLTDGAKYVAENGGTNGAFWLMDAIASHQPQALKNESLREIQFWTLTINPDRSADLVCRVDCDRKPTITQHIEYTDFDLPKIDLWVGPLDGVSKYVIYLPSEY